jgi:putative GTP pyrophosphokinase
MQDLLGFRVTTYFSDDLKIVIDLCEKIFKKVELVYDERTTEIFKPLRNNMICKIPVDESKIFYEL